MHPELERLLGMVPGGDLAEMSMEDIRARRTTAQQNEDSVSYLRRIIQVRLDLLGTELEHRRTGGSPSDSSDLVARLPQILAEEPAVPRSTRRPSTLDLPDVHEALMRTVDEILPTSRLVKLNKMSDDNLVSLVDRLTTLEVEVSAARRCLHERIDALQEEVARRYQMGDVVVEPILE